MDKPFKLGLLLKFILLYYFFSLGSSLASGRNKEVYIFKR